MMNEIKDVEVVFGVDPGLSGGIACFRNNGKGKFDLLFTSPMPVEKVKMKGKIRRRVSAWGLWKTFERCNLMLVKTIFVIEKVHSMPNNGVVQAFAFGDGYGALRAVCELWERDNEIVEIIPREWKKRYGLGSDKNASREEAARRWTMQAKNFARVKDDGRAEAALMAWHFIKTKTGEFEL